MGWSLDGTAHNSVCSSQTTQYRWLLTENPFLQWWKHRHTWTKLQWSLLTFPELCRSVSARWACPEVTYLEWSFTVHIFMNCMNSIPKPLSGTRSNRKSCSKVGLAELRSLIFVRNWIHFKCVFLCVLVLRWVDEQLPVPHVISYFLLASENTHFNFRHKQILKVTLRTLINITRSD